MEQNTTQKISGVVNRKRVFSLSLSLSVSAMARLMAGKRRIAFPRNVSGSQNPATE